LPIDAEILPDYTQALIGMAGPAIAPKICMSRLGLAFIILQLLVCPGIAMSQASGDSLAGGTPAKNDTTPATQQAEVPRARPASVSSEPVIAPPIEGIKPYELRDSFNEMHYGHRHEAIDIMEPKGTPVRAVVDGTIQKLFLSRAGGNTIYEFDEKGRYCYYYAHLERYADGLHDGMSVSRGQIIGYVGSAGDAAAAPHLHFAIYLLGSYKHWWKGAPIDPYPVLERSLLMSSRSSPSQIYLILEMLHAGG